MIESLCCVFGQDTIYLLHCILLLMTMKIISLADCQSIWLYY